VDLITLREWESVIKNKVTCTSPRFKNKLVHKFRDQNGYNQQPTFQELIERSRQKSEQQRLMAQQIFPDTKKAWLPFCPLNPEDQELWKRVIKQSKTVLLNISCGLVWPRPFV